MFRNIFIVWVQISVVLSRSLSVPADEALTLEKINGSDYTLSNDPRLWVFHFEGAPEKMSLDLSKGVTFREKSKIRAFTDAMKDAEPRGIKVFSISSTAFWIVLLDSQGNPKTAYWTGELMIPEPTLIPFSVKRIKDTLIIGERQLPLKTGFYPRGFRDAWRDIKEKVLTKGRK